MGISPGCGVMRASPMRARRAARGEWQAVGAGTAANTCGALRLRVVQGWRSTVSCRTTQEFIEIKYNIATLYVTIAY
ncbi:endonuclease [Edwardsiella tarda]|uniref:Endonuclease n=1 Tax=Edwardsiella tarda TaxID=636 RepID=A0A2A7U3S5_EDWTA|nr:endonuclease [Edwardsiella tarda]